MKSIIFFFCFVVPAFLVCVPITTCKPNSLNIVPNCGTQYDGCGGLVKCYSVTSTNAIREGCGEKEFCSKNVCQAATPPPCVAKTADDFKLQGFSCGPVADGCGGIIELGTCPSSYSCVNSVCKPPATCVSKFASNADFCNALLAKNIQCGNHIDDCGKEISCACASGYSCANNGECRSSSGTCTPKPSTSLCVIPGVASNILKCGIVPDGCSSTVDCSALNYPTGCPNNQVCKDNFCVPLVQTCTKLSACPVEVKCGSISDGCVGTLDCGTCASGSYCEKGVCVNKPTTCTPRTACVSLSQLGLNSLVTPTCGVQSDGCGGLIKCTSNVCPDGTQCDYINLGKCVSKICQPTILKCVANTVSGAECGIQTDNCGNAILCGTCPSNSFCQSGRCVATCNKLSSCVITNSLTGTSIKAECGSMSDGCSGTLNCGTCASGYTCVNNMCKLSTNTCTKLTCQVSNTLAQCGNSTDGCGGILSCGTCPVGSDCITQKCYPKTCVPLTQSACKSFDAVTNTVIAVQCGTIPDGCGGSVTCGTCASNTEKCVFGKCIPTSATCTPITSCDLSKELSVLSITKPECGFLSDGCGGQVFCGKCAAGSYCDKYKCVSACTKTATTCPANTCGFVSDGCGGSIPCSTCTNGFCYEGKCIDCIDLTFTFGNKKPTDDDIKAIVKKAVPGVDLIDITITRTGDTVNIKICPPSTKTKTEVSTSVSKSLNESGFTTETTANAASALVASLFLVFAALLF